MLFAASEQLVHHYKDKANCKMWSSIAYLSEHFSNFGMPKLLGHHERRLKLHSCTPNRPTVCKTSWHKGRLSCFEVSVNTDRMHASMRATCASINLSRQMPCPHPMSSTRDMRHTLVGRPKNKSSCCSYGACIENNDFMLCLRAKALTPWTGHPTYTKVITCRIDKSVDSSHPAWLCQLRLAAATAQSQATLP